VASKARILGWVGQECGEFQEIMHKSMIWEVDLEVVTESVHKLEDLAHV
jgi:hypothetical protein